MGMETEKLLFEIQSAVLCQYLSDLHSTETPFDARAKQLVLAILDNRYSAVTWSDAVNYITGKSCIYDTVLAAKSAIVAKG